MDGKEGNIEHNIDVSIIILTYNLDRKKTEQTIKSAVCQKDIEFEIIVSDDGSVKNPDNTIADIFDKYKYNNYIFNRNEVNLGIVKNILSALKIAKGKYVYLISPGDMIFDDYAMKDFFDFAEKGNVDVCFGNYISYNISNEEVKTLDEPAYSKKPEVYNPPYTLLDQKILFYSGDLILGPAYFRRKDFAEKYIGLISEVSRYVEDNTSTMFSLADNIPLRYFDRKICWYERNVGVSSGSNSEGAKIMAEDFVRACELLKKKHSDNGVIQASLLLKNLKYLPEKYIRQNKFFLVVKHPLVCIKKKLLDRIPDRYITTDANDLRMLKEKLSIK